MKLGGKIRIHREQNGLRERGCFQLLPRKNMRKGAVKCRGEKKLKKISLVETTQDEIRFLQGFRQRITEERCLSVWCHDLELKLI